MNKFCALALFLAASGCAGMEWQTVDSSNGMKVTDDMKQRLESSPKRAPGEVITVSLLQTECDKGLDQRRLFKQLRGHFKQHDTVRPADQKSVDHETEKTKISRSMKPRYDTDLVVRTSATFKRKSGITADGKLGTGTVLLFQADIVSRYDGKKYQVEHSCSPLRNEQGLGEFCNKVLGQISGRIRQTLPADPHYVMTGEETPEWAKKLGKFVQ